MSVRELPSEVDSERPVMISYPGTTSNGDVSNFWGPNRQCVDDLLREFGLSEVELVSENPAASRMAFHARR